ncbi:MAG TPA: TetR/AcrR family transcriptional regulator [Hyphomicrobiaceae bacterium]|nr:TetR/AcrR family transcriptional regulator [Hyphomicrobiaceae bacterium]
MPRADKREHLIDIAVRLFNRHGYHATGVDRIMEETGIAKTTLYRHFASKEDLIVAALTKIDEQSREEMRAFVESASDDPRERVLATFDQLALWLTDCEFKGCPFVAAAAEFGEPGNPVFQAVKLHKRLMLAYIEELVRAARIPDPKTVARQIVMLQEGAIAYAQVLGCEGVIATAKAAAEKLIGTPAGARH